MLYENNYKLKCNKKVNSGNFFSSELEVMKNSKHHEGTADAGMEPKGIWHQLLVMMLEDTVLFTNESVC